MWTKLWASAWEVWTCKTLSNGDTRWKVSLNHEGSASQDTNFGPVVVKISCSEPKCWTGRLQNKHTEWTNIAFFFTPLLEMQNINIKITLKCSSFNQSIFCGLSTGVFQYGSSPAQTTLHMHTTRPLIQYNLSETVLCFSVYTLLQIRANVTPNTYD